MAGQLLQTKVTVIHQWPPWPPELAASALATAFAIGVVAGLLLALLLTAGRPRA